MLGSPQALLALRLSLITATVSMIIAMVLGVPLAWLLARSRRSPGRSLVRALVTLPLVLPPVVGGAALLYSLGRRSPLGSWLEDADVRLTFSSPRRRGAGPGFVALPFLVITVQGALEAGGPGPGGGGPTLGPGR